MTNSKGRSHYFQLSAMLREHCTSQANPFAVQFQSAKGEVCYVLGDQPKSFAWRARGARPHPWKQVHPTVFEAACAELEGTISKGL